jgi:hypothetical protein
MLFRTASDWWNLARTLSFEPHEPSAGYGAHASFRQLKRALGPVVGPPPKWEHWFYGRRSGRECIVLQYETGSGSNRQTWTALVVRLDPPLFLGTSISREGFLNELFGGVDVQLGAPQFDKELRLGAFDREKLRALLYPSDPQSLATLQALVRGTRDGMHVTDSTVVFERSGILTDPIRTAQLLDLGVWVAEELGRRRASMPVTPDETARRAEWQAYATRMNLDFEPAQMKLSGAINGTKLEVALETNGARVQTAVTVRWPHELGVNVRLRKASGVSFLSSLFSQDIETGDPAFDSMFLVQGYPEPWVRQTFAHPDLRATLRNVAGGASELTMNNSGAFWLWPVAAIGRYDLEGHVSMALRASAALFGTVQAMGVYR